MKLFRIENEDIKLHFIKAKSLEEARTLHLTGYEPQYTEKRRNDTIVEVDCLETLIDLLPVEFNCVDVF